MKEHQKQRLAINHYFATLPTDNRNLTEQITTSPEAAAVARIASAAREVRAVSAATGKHFDAIGATQPSILKLARLTAAMQELRDAREEFGRLLSQHDHR